MSLPKKKVNVFIVSDATGITAEMVAGSALVQFRQVEPIFKRFPNVKTEEQIKDILMTVLSTTMGMLLMALKDFHHLRWLLSADSLFPLCSHLFTCRLFTRCLKILEKNINES